MEKHFLYNENIQNEVKKLLRAQEAFFLRRLIIVITSVNWLDNYGGK